MSDYAMLHTWRVSRAKGSELLLALAYANYANDDGTRSCPSMAKLMERTRLTESGVRRIRDRLEEKGEIRIRPYLDPEYGTAIVDLVYADGSNVAVIEKLYGQIETVLRATVTPATADPIRLDPSLVRGPKLGGSKVRGGVNFTPDSGSGDSDSNTPVESNSSPPESGANFTPPVKFTPPRRRLATDPVPRASVAGDFTTALGRLGDAQRAVVDDLLEFGVHPSKASVRALGILTRHPQGVQAARVFLAFARASDNLGPAWVLDRLLHLEDDPLGRWTADPQLWTHYHAPPAETPVNWTAYAFQTCRDTLSRFDFTAPRCADLVSRLAGCFELTEEMPRVVWWMVGQAAASPVPRATIEHQVERVTRDPLAAEVARAFVPDLDAVPPDAHALAVYWRDYLKTHPTLTMCLPPAVTESAPGGPHVHSSAYAVARHSTADPDATVGELDGPDQEGRDP